MTRVLRLIISFSLVLLYWTAVGVVAQFPFCVIYLQDYSLADWVLGRFPAADEACLAERFGDTDAAVRLILSGRVDEAMNRYSK